MFAVIVLVVTAVIALAGGLCLLAERKLIERTQQLHEAKMKGLIGESRIQVKSTASEQAMKASAEMFHLAAMVLMFIGCVLLLLLLWIGYQWFMATVFAPPA